MNNEYERKLILILHIPDNCKSLSLITQHNKNLGAPKKFNHCVWVCFCIVNCLLSWLAIDWLAHHYYLHFFNYYHHSIIIIGWLGKVNEWNALSAKAKKIFVLILWAEKNWQKAEQSPSLRSFLLIEDKSCVVCANHYYHRE